MRFMAGWVVLFWGVVSARALASVALVNGDFESGKTGWELTGGAANWEVLSAAGEAKTGTSCLGGSENATMPAMDPATIAQTMNGTIDEGQYYYLSYWLKSTYTAAEGRPPFPTQEGRLLIGGQVVATTGPVTETAAYDGIWCRYRLVYHAGAGDAGKAARFELTLTANGAANFRHNLDSVTMNASNSATVFLNPAIKPVSRLTEALWSQRMTAVNAQVKQSQPEMIFIGDSITQGWETAAPQVWAQYYGPRKALNLGFSGDQTQNVLWRLNNGNLDGPAPKLAVLLIGVNNTAMQMPPQDTFAGIQAIVRVLRERLPQTKILILGIFPFGASPTYFARLWDNLVNDRLQELADGKMIHFLNIGERFLGADGSLSTQIMGDYLHPTLKGYQIWAEAMEPKVVELLKAWEAEKSAAELRWFEAE